MTSQLHADRPDDRDFTSANCGGFATAMIHDFSRHLFISDRCRRVQVHFATTRRISRRSLVVYRCSLIFAASERRKFAVTHLRSALRLSRRVATYSSTYCISTLYVLYTKLAAHTHALIHLINCIDYFLRCASLLRHYYQQLCSIK